MNTTCTELHDSCLSCSIIFTNRFDQSLHLPHWWVLSERDIHNLPKLENEKWKCWNTRYHVSIFILFFWFWRTACYTHNRICIKHNHGYYPNIYLNKECLLVLFNIISSVRENTAEHPHASMKWESSHNISAFPRNFCFFLLILLHNCLRPKQSLTHLKISSDKDLPSFREMSCTKCTHNLQPVFVCVHSASNGLNLGHP